MVNTVKVSDEQFALAISYIHMKFKEANISFEVYVDEKIGIGLANIQFNTNRNIILPLVIFVKLLFEEVDFEDPNWSNDFFEKCSEWRKKDES